MREYNFENCIATIITWHVNMILVQYHFCVDRGPIIQEKAKNAWDICNVASIAQNDLADSPDRVFFPHFLLSPFCLCHNASKKYRDQRYCLVFFFLQTASIDAYHILQLCFFFLSCSNKSNTYLLTYSIIMCCLFFVPCATYVTLKHECQY